jgi:hypothetical protein
MVSMSITPESLQQCECDRAYASAHRAKKTAGTAVDKESFASYVSKEVNLLQLNPYTLSTPFLPMNNLFQLPNQTQKKLLQMLIIPWTPAARAADLLQLPF